MADNIPANVFDATEYLQWRDVILPVQDWSHRFSHQAIEHHIIYRAGVAIDMMGAQGRVFSYVLPLRNGISKAPFQNAFTGIYYRLYDAYRNKDAGDLIDPVHGPVWAVPGEWDAHTDPNGLDGVEVRLTFREDTPVDGAREDSPPTFAEILTESKSLDDEIQTVDWERPEEVTNTTDLLSAGAGLISQVNRMKEKLGATYLSVVNKIDKLEMQLEELMSTNDPAINDLRLKIRKFRSNLTNAANEPPNEKGKIVSRVVESDTTVTALAAAYGMDLSDFLRLNPGLARNPYVKAETTIRVIKNSKKRTR